MKCEIEDIKWQGIGIVRIVKWRWDGLDRYLDGGKQEMDTEYWWEIVLESIWKTENEMGLKKTVCEDVNWIDVHHVQWWVLNVYILLSYL